ncbi:MAG: SPOR domain-containing protein [Gammaproteobacteria bacterium]
MENASDHYASELSPDSLAAGSDHDFIDQEIYEELTEDRFEDDADILPDRQEFSKPNPRVPSPTHGAAKEKRSNNFDISGDPDEDDTYQEFEFTEEEIAAAMHGDEIIEEDSEEIDENPSHEDFSDEEPAREIGMAGSLSAQILDLKTHINNLWRESEDLAEDFHGLEARVRELNQRNRLIHFLAIGLALFAVIVSGSMVIINSRLQIAVDEILAENDQQIKDSDMVNRLSLIQSQLAELKRQNQLDRQQQTDINEAVAAKLSETTKYEPVETVQAPPKKTESRLTPKSTSVVQAKKSPPSAKTGNWIINLVSLNQEALARKKAAEFQKKGIAVEVTPVMIKGVKWHRIYVGGFETKQEAESQVANIRKTLNLASVWVTKIQ